jgi:hypothetical protein
MEANMYIRTSGKPSKIPVKICKEAIKFYGKWLLKENIYHKITIKILFEDLSSKECAYCETDEYGNKNRDFILTINKNLNKKQILFALAHEMVHVKQYAKGELKDYVRLDKIKWKNEVHDLNNSDYWFQPWEIEAHGMEKGLYVKYIDSLKVKK